MKYIPQNKKIYNLIQAKKTGKAIDYLNKLINKQKDVWLYYMILSEIYYNQHNMVQAIAVLNNCLLSKHPWKREEKLKLYQTLGDYYLYNGELKESFSVYKKALKIDSKNNSLLLQLCIVYLEADKTENATDIFQYLNKLIPDDPVFLSYLGLYYTKLNQSDMCHQIVEKVLQEKPGFHLAQYVLGYTFYNNGDYKKAIEYLKKARVEKSLRLKADYYTGKACMEDKDYRHAIEYFSQAEKYIVSENDLTLDLHYSLYLCYEKEKDFVNALEQLRIIHSVNPEYKDVAEKLISDNYKTLKVDYLMDYKTFSEEEFYQFGKKLVAFFNLEIIHSQILEGENVLFFKCKVKELGVIYKLLQNIINYSSQERVFLLFFRSIPLKQSTLEKYLSRLDIEFKKGVVFSSEPVSPLAINFAHKQNIDVIIPTTLNKIVKQYTSLK